jgi:actin related protein 2/3 complex subunit 1A/1B
VCYFEPTQSFWVAKHLKKQIRSTTLCLDWHPNNALIAAAGTDFKCRLFCAYIKDVDGQAPQASPWGSLSTPADCIAEYAASNHGWVYSCAFNLTGDVLGFVAHDSTVYMVDSSRNAKEYVYMLKIILFTIFLF